MDQTILSQRPPFRRRVTGVDPYSDMVNDLYTSLDALSFRFETKAIQHPDGGKWVLQVAAAGAYPLFRRTAPSQTEVQRQLPEQVQRSPRETAEADEPRAAIDPRKG